ncbi:UDP-2-acetamido-2,6-beta-L-arabino-hexul-4-ose reductase [Rhizobium sp. 'Codium 1']|uniref:UDP-2-acetamido-2,6-beta-L-arabino-hexul-4-ose reductase n=1 Tax=Rhizobium sp. 'Codium 1' TaxID=2940484 RepID=UPI001E602BEB|nr:capsular polysaccharide biosynthesis protein CapF [Rhizobium sp. 'Codium 1']MCC8934864.1 capsular polysaccharide biosynthesis protein CapF [Rhizobium sp. 'Codium 1']
MKVLITGVNGFIGKNLRLHLAERADVEVVGFTREQESSQIPELLDGVDFVFHLAGVNRPRETADFAVGNADLTAKLCVAVASVFSATGRRIPVVFSSSIQAALDNPYGASKRAAEDTLFALQRQHGVPVHLFRLPNVFGKWCKSNYNSAIATFCHNVARDLPIRVDDPTARLTLVYVDDVVRRFISLMDGADAVPNDDGFEVVAPQYTTTVGDVARLIHSFRDSRQNLMTERVGSGMVRALYATYVSYLPPEAFAYSVPMYRDPRGVFAEMLKTPDCGQFSYFTAYPGVTRGGHYHHSKTEKFLVIKGQARFKFRQMHTGETHELTTSGEKAEIVETAPGWTHDITNIGYDEMIVMLWANEVFERQRPDTIVCPL